MQDTPFARASCAVGRHRQRKQRAENDLGAFVERLLRALARALRAAAVVLDQKLDVRILEFRQRHLGGVLHRQRRDAGIAGRRQRQDQSDFHLPGADRERLLRRTGCRLQANWKTS